MDRNDMWDDIIARTGITVPRAHPLVRPKTIRKQQKAKFLEVIGLNNPDVTPSNYLTCIDKYTFAKEMEKNMETIATSSVTCECHYCNHSKWKNPDPKQTPRPRTEEDDKREYILQRLEVVRDNKWRDARTQFFMDEQPPKTVEELIRRIQDEKFTLPTDEEILRKENDGYYLPSSIIIWRDPSTPPKVEEYKVAVAKIDVDYLTAKDKIMALSGSAMFQALDAFKDIKD